MTFAYSIRPLSSLKEASEMGGIWQRLALPDRSVTTYFDWYHCCTATLHGVENFRWIVARDGADDIIAIIPLVKRTRHGIGWLEFAGASALYEPNGFVYRDADCLNAVCNFMVQQGLPVELQRVGVGSPIVDAFIRAGSSRGKVFVLDTAESAYVQLPQDPAKLPETYSRQRRRLRAKGELSTEYLRPDSVQIDSLLGDALRLEASGWKGRSGTAILCNPKMSAFFRQMAERFCSQGAFILTFLCVDGERIAMEMMVEAGDAWWGLKIGFDEKWAKFSPGAVLRQSTLRTAIQAGVKRYEFLGSMESWQSLYDCRTRSYNTLVFIPYNFKGGRVAITEASQRIRSKTRNLVSTIGRLRQRRRGNG